MDKHKIGSLDFYCGIGLGLAAAALYLGFLSKTYVFEGLARAMPIELGSFRGLFNGNHLAYGFAGFCFHGVLKLLGCAGLALISLQVMDALIGGLGLCCYFLTLRCIGATRASAAAWSAVLALSLGYWNWSTDAENYIFSTCLLILLFSYLIFSSMTKRLSPYGLALLHGLAVSGHIVNVVFVAVGAWFLFSCDPRNGRRLILAYALSLGVLLCAVYAAALALIVRPSNMAAALHWLLGSASGGGQSLVWHGALGPGGFAAWAKMTLNIFVSFLPGFQSPAAWAPSAFLSYAGRSACLAFFILTAVRFKKLEGSQRTTAIGCLIWLGAYAAVFTSWEPRTMVYRVSDLVPLVTLFFLAAQTLPRSWMSPLAGVCLAALLGAANFSAEIYPRSFFSNNPNLTHMALIKANTTEADWVTGEGGGDELYIPYFAQRKPLTIGFYHSRLPELKDRIEQARMSGGEIFVTSKVLSSPEWRRFFDGYGLELRAAGQDGYALYHLK
ncbi:MAG: hypothetical protein WCU88_01150 [Elusimicrobiota bacterium]|jgi:hypothetical protein